MNDDLKQLALDLSVFHNITFEQALYQLGFTPEYKSIHIGNVEAARKLGITVKWEEVK